MPVDYRNNIQTLGTARGTKIALTYAALTLPYLEENLYKIIGKKYNAKTEFIMEKIPRRLFHILEMPREKH